MNDIVEMAQQAVDGLCEGFRDTLEETIQQEYYSSEDSLEYKLDKCHELEFVRDAPELILHLIAEVKRLRALVEESKGEL